MTSLRNLVQTSRHIADVSTGARDDCPRAIEATRCLRATPQDHEGLDMQELSLPVSVVLEACPVQLTNERHLLHEILRELSRTPPFYAYTQLNLISVSQRLGRVDRN